MQRRKALKNLSLSIGSAILLPSWANAWKPGIASNQKLISSNQELLLAEIVETIIPKTDTLGAKELEVHSFIIKMIADCFDKKTQSLFQNGLKTVDEMATKSFQKIFVDLNKETKLKVLNTMRLSDNKEEKAFLNLVKNLTIQGYLSSEYVMTNLLPFEFAPGRYNGCVPVSK